MIIDGIEDPTNPRLVTRTWNFRSREIWIVIFFQSKRQKHARHDGYQLRKHLRYWTNWSSIRKKGDVHVAHATPLTQIAWLQELQQDI
ncbi:Hypothetical predicted protein [Olea europaea subsp. europaea]|uniref:Uncharacterized protein n=1 Tax=Olea europaea subsp. europaea TaxID=158383 RepID=A0A8S0T9E2_OLEEU|nr:Hypothetical predicted protein [Olea europaea subsp. europaea]